MDAATTSPHAYAISGNLITKKMKLFNFPTRTQNSPLSEDVIQYDSVEICSEDDGGCGYAKASCVCSIQKRNQPSGPSEIGAFTSGRSFGTTLNLDEDK